MNRVKALLRRIFRRPERPVKGTTVTIYQPDHPDLAEALLWDDTIDWNDVEIKVATPGQQRKARRAHHD